MNVQVSNIVLDKPLNAWRLSQMQFLCHSLDLFASADPVMLAGASHYADKLRQEGCKNDEIIKIAATALLVVIEQEIEKITAV